MEWLAAFGVVFVLVGMIAVVTWGMDMGNHHDAPTPAESPVDLTKLEFKEKDRQWLVFHGVKELYKPGDARLSDLLGETTPEKKKTPEEIIEDRMIAALSIPPAIVYTAPQHFLVACPICLCQNIRKSDIYLRGALSCGKCGVTYSAGVHSAGVPDPCPCGYRDECSIWCGDGLCHKHQDVYQPVLDNYHEKTKQYYDFEVSTKYGTGKIIK